MQCALEGKYFQPLVDSMLLSNQIALQLATRSDITAMTDVTGFGLAGHLKEMLIASNKSAKLDLSSIPLLPGCQEMLDQNIESTLAPDNRINLASIGFTGIDIGDRRVASLFDPQTGGGLLFGVKANAADQVLGFMNDGGFEQACVIGEVVDSADTGSSIAL
jgi:selenide,water dikinase